MSEAGTPASSSSSAGRQLPADRAVIGVGERVLLIDSKDRRYLVRLVAGGNFSTHAGVVHFDDIIGGEEGTEVIARQRESSSSPTRRLLVLRPTLADVVLKMPRGAQVIYPKDLASILMAADLFPGARVLEAGVGSGALSMTTLRAGCDVVGYEVRPDFAQHARANVAEHFGPDAPYRVDVRDVYEGIDESGLDRILLDLPEPWRVLEHAATALRPGGIICAYLPSINQTAEFRAALDHRGFGFSETFETLRRTWHIEGRSVRPDHRMVAHTGFITTARRVAARAGRRRPISATGVGQDGDAAGEEASLPSDRDVEAAGLGAFDGEEAATWGSWRSDAPDAGS